MVFDGVSLHPKLKSVEFIMADLLQAICIAFRISCRVDPLLAPCGYKPGLHVHYFNNDCVYSKSGVNLGVTLRGGIFAVARNLPISMPPPFLSVSSR